MEFVFQLLGHKQFQSRASRRSKSEKIYVVREKIHLLTSPIGSSESCRHRVRHQGHSSSTRHGLCFSHVQVGNQSVVRIAITSPKIRPRDGRNRVQIRPRLRKNGRVSTTDLPLTYFLPFKLTPLALSKAVLPIGPLRPNAASGLSTAK